MMLVLVLKVVALAMGAVSIVLGFFPKETNTKTQIRAGIYGIGHFAIAMFFQPLASCLYCVAA